MVLTSEFWINYSKNEPEDPLVDKTINDDIYIRIEKTENSYHAVSCCFYKGPDFNTFYGDIVNLVEKKIQQFQIKGTRGLKWYLRISDEPKNLHDLLISKGYEKTLCLDKMGLDLESFEMGNSINNFGFDIEHVEKERMFEGPVVKLILNAYPNEYLDADDVRRKFSIRFENLEKKGDIRENFLVYTKFDHKPVAYASLLFIHNIPNVAYLYGAVTDQEFGHRGIYTALLFKRLQRCKELGLRYVIVDANQKTSGPILKKFGFKLFDPVEIYQLKFNFNVKG